MRDHWLEINRYLIHVWQYNVFNRMRIQSRGSLAHMGGWVGLGCEFRHCSIANHFVFDRRVDGCVAAAAALKTLPLGTVA